MNRLRRELVDLVAGLPFGQELLAEGSRLKKDLRSVYRAGVPWQHREAIWPSDLLIEPTNMCNANCIFCAYQYQGKWRAERGIIDAALFRDVVDVHAAKGGRSISLTPTVGDPLVDPNIVEKVRYIIGRGLQVSFFTNGILFNRIDQEAFLASGIPVVVLSTGPLDRESFERIYRSKRYDDVLEGTERLLTLRNRLNAPFALHLSFRSHLSYRETLALPDFRRRIWPLLSEEERRVIVVLNSYDNWAGQIKKSDLLPGMRMQRPVHLASRPCIWTFSPMVSWDGKVRACACRFLPTPQVTDELVVGDLREAGLEEIWMGDRVKALRRRFVSKDRPTVCRNCPVYTPC